MEEVGGLRLPTSSENNLPPPAQAVLSRTELMQGEGRVGARNGHAFRGGVGAGHIGRGGFATPCSPSSLRAGGLPPAWQSHQ